MSEYQRHVATYRRLGDARLKNLVKAQRTEGYLPVNQTMRNPFWWNFMSAALMATSRSWQVEIVDIPLPPDHDEYEPPRRSRNVMVYASEAHKPVVEDVMAYPYHFGRPGGGPIPSLAAFLYRLTAGDLLGENLMGPRADLEGEARGYFPNEPIENAKLLTLRGFMASLVLRTLSHEAYDAPRANISQRDRTYYEALEERGYKPIPPEPLDGLALRVITHVASR